MTDETTAYGPHAMPIGRGVKLVLGLLAVVGCVAAGASVIGALNDASQARSDEIAACWSSFTIELVFGPQAKALKALAVYGVDSDEFQAATASIDPDALAKLARLSRTDSDAFLAECRQRSPG